MMKLTPTRKRILAVTAGLSGWLALMCCPFGNYIAVSTILVLIVVLFALGFINVQHPDHRNRRSRPSGEKNSSTKASPPSIWNQLQ